MAVGLTVAHGDREVERVDGGEVRPGESWLAAARRTAGSSGEPVPVDLAAHPRRWAVEPDRQVTVRPATRGDLPDLTAWRQSEAVRRWWAADGEPTPANVEAQYADALDGREPTLIWVVDVNGRSVGFVQDYRLSDHPEYAVLTPDPDAIGVDYAIGDPAWLRRGLGPRMLWAWMLRMREVRPAAEHYFAAPDHRNRASLRCLEKVGFVPGLWFDEPQTDGSVATVVGCTLDVAAVLGPVPAGGHDPA